MAQIISISVLTNTVVLWETYFIMGKYASL